MTNNERVLAIIPARYESSRFPGKPLAEIHDRPMIHWVIDGVDESSLVDDVIVATDDERIYESVTETEAKAVMTSSSITSGSDRVATVAEDHPADLIVNVQGDEPLIKSAILDQGIEAMLAESEVPMVSFMTEAGDEIRNDPDAVKVVVDRRNHALYFSRSAIPYRRADDALTHQHIGIYLFRRDFLLKYAKMEPTPLEESEGLEQLRALENGHTIKMVEIAETTVGVDRPGDISLVEDLLDERSDKGI